MSNSSVTVAAVGPRAPPAFTLVQWQELEHQALIFKYFKAGLPVPPYLLLPLRKSFQLLSPPFFQQPSTLSYYSSCGKKIDSEPGRCRRTDGKKWRCSKDAHPDSKYCERHMNRSRNRSRKPVESKTASQSLSTVASEIAGSDSGNCTFSNLPPPSVGNSEALPNGRKASPWQMESTPYGLSGKEYRSLHGPRAKADDHKISPEALGSIRGHGTNSTVDSMWHLTSGIHSNPLTEPKHGAFLQNNQLKMLPDFEPLALDAAMSKQRQHVFGREFSSSGSTKQEIQPIFSGWPRSRGLDSYLIDQRSNSSSSTIQLSMAIPMVPNSAVRGFHSPYDASKECG